MASGRIPAGLVALLVTWQVAGGQRSGLGDLGHDLGDLLRRVAQERLSGCFLVLMGYRDGILSQAFSSGFFPRVFVDVEGALDDALEGSPESFGGLLGSGSTFGCRAIMAEIRGRKRAEIPFRLLERMGLHRFPETFVVVVGPEISAGAALLSGTFRNSPKILYVAHGGGEKRAGKRGKKGPFWRRFHDRFPEGGEKLNLYTRSLYRSGVELVEVWSLSEGFEKGVELFREPTEDFRGFKFKVVTMNWFPFIDFERVDDDDDDDEGTLVAPSDSLDFRMLSSISKKLNFTYEMRVPRDNQWGTSSQDGGWSGIVGCLQRQEADFSMMLSWMEARLPVVDYSGIYASEPLVMVTSRALPLPRALALIRPFSGSLWLAALASTLLWGFVLWASQGASARASGGRGCPTSPGEALTAAWRILLQNPPAKTPRNATAQVVVCSFWVHCMLLTIVYRSSLIAHLTVPGRARSLESLQDLVRANDEGGGRPRWTWGYEPTYGSGWEWLKVNESPVVKRVFNDLLVLELQDQLERVLEGRHAFITWKYYIRSIVAARFTDSRGFTPIRTAKEEFFNYGGYGWGFRKGAPFRPQIDKLKLRLKEGGFIDFWLDELIEASGRRARHRKMRNKGGGAEEEKEGDVNGETVVLGPGHLQGVFYALFIGHFIALSAFLVERGVVVFRSTSS